MSLKWCTRLCSDGQIQLCVVLPIILTYTLVSQCYTAENQWPLKLSPYISANDYTRVLGRQLSRVWGLPGFIPRSHSGYITVKPKLGNHYFFWYFPSNTNTSAPLVVWLNGGPGMTSLQGLFWQNGPITFNSKNDRVTFRKNSFVGPFSVLYIDNPVGTGFSYSDSGDKGLRGTMEEYGEDLADVLEQFVQLFPQYQTTNDVYIGGQSYAGKYVPAMAYQIHKKKLNGISNINLKGIYIAGPLFDPETQFEGNVDFYSSMGVITNYQSDVIKRNIRLEFQKFYKGLLANETEEQLFSVNYPFEAADNYVTGEIPSLDPIYSYVTSKSVIRALHVSTTTYTPVNRYVFTQLLKNGDLRNSSKQYLGELMDNYKVLIYNGEYDSIVTTSGIEAGLLSTTWVGLDHYRKASRTQWNYNQQTLGHFSKVGNFCRVVVRGAGHQVSYDKPDSVLAMLQQFVDKGCIYNE